MKLAPVRVLSCKHPRDKYTSRLDVHKFSARIAVYIFFCLSYHKGKELGTILGMPLAGVLCASDIWGGWPSVFYVFGKYFPRNTVNKEPSLLGILNCQ